MTLLHTLRTVGDRDKQSTTEIRSYYPALDGLRGVAFLLVFFQHYWSIPWGWSGVNIFFVLSGLLITGKLFDSRYEAHRARNFYIRRVLRIFPLYYGVMLSVLLVDPIFQWHWSRAWLAWPCYLANFLPFISPTMLTAGSSVQLAANAWLQTPRAPFITLYFGHFWSLCVEEQFYLCWPWIVFWIPSERTLVWICSVAVVLVPILRDFAQHLAPHWLLEVGLLDRATPFQLDALLLGGLIALLLRGPHRKRIFEVGAVIALYATLLSAFFLAIEILRFYPNWRVGYAYPSWKFTWGLTFIDLYAGGLILCALQSSGLVYRFLNLRILRWMGRISYGAYVFHDIFHTLYQEIVRLVGIQCRLVSKNAELCVLLIGLTCTLLLSWLSFRFFESIFLDLKECWTAFPRKVVVQESSQD